MDIDQIICSYRKLSVEDKRNENINNLKVLITVFESICDKQLSISTPLIVSSLIKIPDVGFNLVGIEDDSL